MLGTHHLSLALALSLAGSACTGFTFGENGPGGDGDGPNNGTFLGTGSIAVDGDTETSFVLTEQRSASNNLSRLLMGARVDATAAQTVADLTNFDDERIMFTSGGALVMAERGAYDELMLFDRGSLQMINSRSTSSRYHGTRVSGSGDFVVVADNDDDNIPLHVIRTDNLGIQPIPHGGDTLEANWMNDSDRLLAITFDYGPTLAESSARLLSWSIREVHASNYLEGPSGVWANPQLDITIPGTATDSLFSFHWVTVGPGDKHAAISVLRDDGNGGRVHQLLVLDIESGQVRTVDRARGPVGFTPDGSTIVSYRYIRNNPGDPDDTTESPYLLLVDAETLDTEIIDTPLPQLPNYFVTREGNFVVVASYVGSSELQLFDLDNGTNSQLGNALDLHEFVSRPGAGELWIVDEGLHRLDIMSANLEPIELDFEPLHINRLPRDELVVDDDAQNRLVFIDPDTDEILRTVSLDDESGSILE